jgi:cholestenol delta-isomerase
MIHHDHMASAQDLFGQLWKEYALSDSRYMTSDTLVLCMETMTVVSVVYYEYSIPAQCNYNPLTSTLLYQLLWGPLCFVVAYLTTQRHSLRHPMQLVVCMSHLYGDTLYYATSLFDDYVNGVSYCRPEGYYFWLYYFFMNFIWIVVPGCMHSYTQTQTQTQINTDTNYWADYFYDSISTISAAIRAQQAQQVSDERRKSQ